MLSFALYSFSFTIKKTVLKTGIIYSSMTRFAKIEFTVRKSSIITSSDYIGTAIMLILALSLLVTSRKSMFAITFCMNE
jgi:hypothetical protein